MARQTTRRTVGKARALRREMSLPEVLLWQELRRAPMKFRRQHPVGPYVLDFYCPAARLGIEIDGIAHDLGDRSGRDASRDAFLHARGSTIMRIAAKDVLESPAEVAEAICAACRE